MNEWQQDKNIEFIKINYKQYGKIKNRAKLFYRIALDSGLAIYHRLFAVGFLERRIGDCALAILHWRFRSCPILSLISS